MAVGKIQQLSTKFRWTIPQFFKEYTKYCISCTSPKFVMAGSKWYFTLSTRVGGPNDSEKICLNMFCLSEPKGVFSFTFGIEDRYGRDDVREEIKYDSTVDGLKAVFSVELSKILKERRKISKRNYLTFTCKLNSNQTAEEAPLEMTCEETTTEFTNVAVTMEDEDKSYYKDCCRHTKGAERSLRNFTDLCFSKENSDVTLRVKDREFFAHRAILGAQSSVFGSMFKDDFEENRNSTVDITDCDPDSFQEFLIYLYCGKVRNMTTSNVVELYSAADKYAVAELKMECVQFMNQGMSVQTFCGFYGLALKYSESKLLQTGIEFFVKNAKMVIVTYGWQTFERRNFDAATELHLKSLD